ncbi:MAG: hypothetical protein D4S01_03090 [Dehalococcoidia bacterium]|nr:MAG: hypothetical protein D4S01_03090 [Dehalococcoidia bacterium]
MVKTLFATPFTPCYDNDFGTDGRAFIPEVWAQESLMVLEENLVAGNLVHRAFEDEVAEYGDVVNTRRPGRFTAKRKTDSDNVTIQDATAEKVQIKMNQHLHTTFLIKDGEMSKSMKDLVAEYLTPAVQSIANAADQIILNQAYQFMGNSVGQLGVDPGKSTVIAANTLMNTNKVPVGPGMRNFILTPGAEGALLDVSDFTKVNEAGDGGEALQNAMLGRKFGFDFYMDQNAPSIPATQTTQAAAVNKVGGYAIASTTMIIDGTSDVMLPGQWFSVVGDGTPQMILTATNTPTTVITFTPGLKRAVDNDAVITVMPYGAVDLTAGYAAGWVKDLTVKSFSDAPLAGQMISSGITAATVDTYGLIGAPTATNIALDREVQTALVNSQQLALGPSGDFCLGFHPNAIALVSRPLVTVDASFGANQFVASFNGLSMRVSMQYDGTAQGMLTTVDMLCGVKVLDPDLGVVMYG